jgi:pyruvate/2-oxoglutarate dehydrogenase complex dihydrolipoamide dehydrogenase (E3) component
VTNDLKTYDLVAMGGGPAGNTAATVASSFANDVFPFGQGEIYDSDTILKLNRIPKILAVVGAGVIGAEYACTFRALGAEVHILDGRDVLLPFFGCGSFSGTGGCAATQRDRFSLERKCP